MKTLIRKGANGFATAFANARKQGLTTFKWNGGTYSTQLAGEEHRPQTVTIQGLNIDPEEAAKHGAFQTKMINENILRDKAPIVEMLSADAVRNMIKGNPVKKTLIGQNKDGRVTYIDADLYNKATSAYLNTKGKNLSDEEVDAYEKATDSYTTVLPTINVNASYKKAADDGIARAGFVPINNTYYYDGNYVNMDENPLKGRLFENTSTGEYAITNNKGEIIYRSDDPNVIFSPETAKIYRGHYTRNDVLDNAAKIQAKDQSAEREVDSHINNGWNPETGQYQTTDLGAEIKAARNTFANGANALVNVPNHMIAGGIRTAVNDDYSFEDYKQGFFNKPEKSTVGLGDIMEMNNPNYRFFANMINPGSVFYTVGNTYANSTYSPGKFDVVNGKKSLIKLPSQGNVNGGSFTRGNKPWLEMGTSNIPTRNGYSRSITLYGGTHTPISQGGNTTMHFSTPHLQYTPSLLSINGNAKTWMPLMFFDSKESKSWAPEFLGYEDVAAPNNWGWQYASTGNMPETNYNIIANDSNTNGGDYVWMDPHSSTISTVASGSNKKARGKSKTKGKPSK